MSLSKFEHACHCHLIHTSLLAMMGELQTVKLNNRFEKMKILIVDDNSTVRRMISRELEDPDCEIFEAGDGPGKHLFSLPKLRKL